MMYDRQEYAETLAYQRAWSSLAPVSECEFVRSSYSSEKYYVQFKHDIIYISASQFR